MSGTPKIEAQYDWTTGVPDNGNEWMKVRVVPGLHPLRSLVLHFCLKGVEGEGLSDNQGRAGIIVRSYLVSKKGQFWAFCGCFRDLFADAKKNVFETFVISGLEGPETPVNGRSGGEPFP